jgi:cytochrome c5
MKRQLALLSIALLLVACAGSKKMQPTAADVERMNSSGSSIDLASLNEGYTLYEANCGKCHALEAPSSHSVADWEQILPAMFPKTKLTDSEQAKVRAYVMARR